MNKNRTGWNLLMSIMSMGMGPHQVKEKTVINRTGYAEQARRVVQLASIRAKYTLGLMSTALDAFNWYDKNNWKPMTHPKRMDSPKQVPVWKTGAKRKNP